MNDKIISRIDEENYNSFGSLMIIKEYKNCENINVYFPEYNWTYYHSTYKEFKNGHIKCPFEPRYCNIGYLGEGKYKVMKNKEKTKEYITWSSMLNRCYSNKYSAYENCYVCDNWLNFQNFSQWYEDNYYEINGEIMTLDKDILYKGNTCYSPDTCVFVPQKINTLFVKSNRIRGKLPIGVTTTNNNKFISRCKNGKNEKIYLGTYDTPEEAFYAYKSYKEKTIKQLADEYKNYIPCNLYIAMYNYEVDIND